MLNSHSNRVVAAGMSMLMVGSLAACGSVDTAETVDEKGVIASEDDLEEVISDSLGTSSSSDADKEETVYVIADANGTAQEILVDEWLKNPDGADVISDVSALQDIKNVKGDETFSQDGTKLTWQAGGSDIYYQGTSDEEAPVAVNVTYSLDGKDISPEELAGKSGHVVIRYEYENNSKSGDVYTPFVMATGMILSQDNFKNVEAENAKVISDGSRYIVVGYGLPGLADSLKLDEDEITLPDYFEVEADAEDFELGMTVTVASVESLGDDEDIDISEYEDEINDLAGEYQDGMDTLVSGISEYTDGVDQVASGVNTLSSGSETLYSGAGSLKSGIESAADGADTIKNGLDSAYDGSKQVSSGADTLADGADTLASAAKKLNSGAGTLSTGAGNAYSGAKQVSDGAAELNEAVQAIDLPDVSSMSSGSTDAATLQAITKTAESQLGSTTSEYVGNSVTNIVKGNMSKATQFAQYYATVSAGGDGTALGQQKASTAAENQATTAASLAGNAAGSASYTNGDNSNVDAAKQAVISRLTDAGVDETTAATLAETLTQAAYKTGYGSGYGTGYCTGYGSGYGAEYAQSMQDTGNYITSLQSGFSGEDFSNTITNVASAYASAGSQVTLTKVGTALGTFSDKLDELKAGTQSLADGSASLTSGLGTLKSGATELANGTDALSTGAGTLSSGAGTLASGASTLNDGLSQLDTGAGTLQSGMDQLESGSATLYNGTKTLKDGVSELKSGTDTLSSNSSALNDGAGQLQTATDTLISKLNETEDGVDDFVDNVNAVKAAARDYSSFGGLSGNMTGKTKFIIKVNSVDTPNK